MEKESRPKGGHKWGQQVVHYVGKVLEVQEDGHIKVLYGRCRNITIKATFHFPTESDVEALVRSRILGVLTTKAGQTARQANVVKVWPALSGYNIR